MAEVGRNLTLTSEQDSNRYDSKQQSASAGGSFTFGTMTPSGSLNLSKDKMHSTYDSVQEQTDLFAGKGGFDVKVGEHTQLNGAVIGSTASAEHNRLETGTLGFSDIDNQAGYKVEHQSVGASTGGGMANFIGNLANGLAVAGNKEKSDSSTTHAAVSEGTIVINDTAKQQQNVDDLSHDVEHAHQTLSPIFDKEKEQQRMQTLQLIGEVGNQAADIARTQGEIAGLKAQSDPAALEAARAELMVNGNSHPTSEQVAKQAYQTAQGAFGTGSAIQQAITASTAAIQGLAGGDIAKALAGGAAPYIAEVIHRQTTSADGEVNKTANLMAHAVVNAALSLAKGENALAGASSAVTAEAVGLISKEYYDKNPSELREDEKQTVSALASLAAGLAGGLVGGDTASAVSGMQTGKVTVENNLMGGTEDGQEKFGREHGKNIASCADNPGSASCQKGLAMQDALTVVLPAGLGGGVLIAATPEIAAILKAGVESCAGALALCINNLGLQASEIIVPGGVGAGGAIGIGKTAAEATAAKAEVVAANAAKNTSSWQAGEYLDDFKVSSTPLELVKEQAGKGPQTAYIRLDHILNGEVKTLKDGTKVGSGGHYIRDPNIKVDKITGAPDVNGVSTGYISVRDPATGQWVNKKAQTTFFPEHWSKRQTAQEIESAFKGSERIPNTEMWIGKSSSGLEIQGYYGKPDGTGATAWPVYFGRKK